MTTTTITGLPSAATPLSGAERVPMDQTIGTAIAASALVAGTGYRIESVGNTNWTACGLPAGVTAAVGLTFVATAAGTGTGTAIAIETRDAAVSDIAALVPGTNLAYTAATRVLSSSTGDDVTLPLFGTTLAGLVGASGGGTINYLRADGTWAEPFDPAIPGPIGGTTPAAGTFSALVATTRLGLPSGAPASPVARDLYQVADTLRYRDSGGVERLLLNGADNLANLANLVTARNNLGLGSAATAAATDFVSATTTRAANLILAGPTSGAAASPTFRALVAADLPATPTEIGLACSDETTALTTGTAKITIRMPYAMTLTSVRLSVTTAPTGSALIVDVNEGGTSIFSTNPRIDAGSTTSVGSGTPAVISDTALADNAVITVDIDQIGSTVAGTGLKVWLTGRRA